MNNKVIIIGCGGIGARHLQGLLKSRLPLAIDVFDISDYALKNAQLLANEIAPGSSATKVNYLSQLPQLEHYSVAIIATTSTVRLNVLKSFLKNNQTQGLVLEKFLFPNQDDYLVAEDLITKSNIKAYVNCPRRMNSFYRRLKAELDTNEDWQFEVSGYEWGLACNAVHFLDLYHYLFGHQKQTINSEQLIPKVFDSKRKGYKEVFGTLQNDKGNITISCEQGSPISIKVVLTSKSKKIEIDEIKGKVIINENHQNGLVFNTVYQSDLSYQFVEQFINSGDMPLTPFTKSACTHLSLLQPLEEHFKKHCESESTFFIT